MSTISTRTDVNPLSDLDGRKTAGQVLTAKSPRVIAQTNCTINGKSYTSGPTTIRSDASPKPSSSFPKASPYPKMSVPTPAPVVKRSRSPKSFKQITPSNVEKKHSFNPLFKSPKAIPTPSKESYQGIPYTGKIPSNDSSTSQPKNVFDEVQSVKYNDGEATKVLTSNQIDMKSMKSMELERRERIAEREKLKFDKERSDFEQEKRSASDQIIMPIRGSIPIQQINKDVISPIKKPPQLPNISTESNFMQRSSMKIGGFKNIHTHDDLPYRTVDRYNYTPNAGNYRPNNSIGTTMCMTKEMSPKTPTFAINPNRAPISPPKALPTPQNDTLTQPPTGSTDTRPDYRAMTREERADMRVVFRAKFGTLRASFTEWNIQDPSNDMTLDEIHDTYEGYVRQIMISLNSSNWKTYLTIMFLGIEVIGIKIFGLDFGGYTMSQMKTMKAYDRLFVQLGEKYYVQGSSNWPIEAQFLMMAGFNGLIFLAVKYLSKWCGGDEMASTIQDMVTSFLGGGDMFNTAKANKDENGISLIPGVDPKPDGSTNAAPSDGLNNILSSLAPMLGGMMGGNGGNGGNGGDMSEMIANIGNMFTQNMGNSNAPKPSTASDKEKPTAAPRPRRRAFG